jgi:hypothetical protein
MRQRIAGNRKLRKDEPSRAPQPLEGSIRQLESRIGGRGDSQTHSEYRWAELIYRIYEVDPLDCPRCGARMKILAFITDPKLSNVARKVLPMRLS